MDINFVFLLVICGHIWRLFSDLRPFELFLVAGLINMLLACLFNGADVKLADRETIVTNWQTFRTFRFINFYKKR